MRDMANDGSLTSDEVYNTMTSVSEIAATLGASFDEELYRIFLDSAFRTPSLQV